MSCVTQHRVYSTILLLVENISVRPARTKSYEPDAVFCDHGKLHTTGVRDF